MRGERRLDLHVSDQVGLADVELPHVREAALGEQGREPTRSEDRRRASHAVERAEIEVIVLAELGV